MIIFKFWPSLRGQCQKCAVPIFFGVRNRLRGDRGDCARTRVCDNAVCVCARGACARMHECMNACEGERVHAHERVRVRRPPPPSSICPARPATWRPPSPPSGTSPPPPKSRPRPPPAAPPAGAATWSSPPPADPAHRRLAGPESPDWSHWTGPVDQPAAGGARGPKIRLPRPLAAPTGHQRMRCRTARWTCRSPGPRRSRLRPSPQAGCVKSTT